MITTFNILVSFKTTLFSFFLLVCTHTWYMCDMCGLYTEFIYTDWERKYIFTYMYIYTYLNIYTYRGFINVLYMLSYKFPNSLNNYKHSSVPINTFPHCHLTFFMDLSATRQQATWYWLEGLFQVKINIVALSKHLPNGWVLYFKHTLGGSHWIHFFQV